MSEYGGERPERIDRLLRKGERIKFLVNFGIEFFRQQEVSISCKEKEVKLVTRSKGQERLMRLGSAYGKPFPFMIKDRRVDKETKYFQLCGKHREGNWK